MWKSLSGHPIRDLPEAVLNLLAGTDQVIHIGSDSQHNGRHTHYATVVAVVQPGSGGRVFYRRARWPRIASLAHRLFQEAQLSLEVALLLSEHVAHDIVVHVDVNQDHRHRSSRYVRALAGMVVGHGFEVRVKPNSWCATHVADSLVKGRQGHAA